MAKGCVPSSTQSRACLTVQGRVSLTTQGRVYLIVQGRDFPINSGTRLPNNSEPRIPPVIQGRVSLKTQCYLSFSPAAQSCIFSNGITEEEVRFLQCDMGVSLESAIRHGLPER